MVSITSTVQVNAKAGFSIITYTGNGSSAQTVGHGLGVAPKIIFIKERAGSNSWDDWIVGGDEINNWTKYLRLNTTDPPTTGYQTAPFSDTAPTSSVFTVTYQGGAGINGNGDTFVAYAFAEKAGYSKFGSYTGNGTTQVVNTGFKPGWIMIKSTAGNDNWRLYDTARGITAGGFLEPNRSDAEDTADAPNFLILSNGFEITAGGTTVGNNVNGNLYTYYAFASDQSAAPVLADSFANKLWTGDGSARDINVGFSPSWTWIKSRSFARNNYLYDILRGPNNQILSNSTGAEATITGRLTAFNTGGFTLGSSSEVNNNAETYVAWNWKANPIPTINTDGTIQSIVSANQAAGFSIVKYTGNATSGATVGHGLSNAPDVVIAKGLSGSGSSWWVRDKNVSSTDVLELNSSNAQANYSSVFNNTDPTSTVVTLGSGDTNRNNETQILYCFHSIAGFSKMGTYTGTGATHAITGVGFQPDWIMGKEVDGVDSWEMVDSARGINKMVYANGANAEVTNTNFTSFDSDGFTLSSATSINENGKTYIYMAFKENPSPVVPAGQMAYLVVAGGAGGGGTVFPNKGGGGGAGGLRTSFGSTSGGGASVESNLTLSSGTYTITVGAGGGAAANGVASTISGTGTVSTVGGGQGGAITVSGTAGGSGGGTGGNNGGSITGGAGTAGEGFAGGTTAGNAGYDGSGGGGAAQAGGNGGFRNTTGGVGGNGLAVSITGASVAYAGGGGGGSDSTSVGARPGGTGGGGAGGSYLVAGVNGTANLGGGAGAGGEDAQPGTGGSGVVILRMRTSDYSGSTTGSPTVTTEGRNSINIYR